MAAIRVGPSVGSARNREHEVGDAVALDACRRVAEHDVFGGELAEEGAVSLAHHHRHQVDGHLVQQPQFQALPGVGPSGDSDDPVRDAGVGVLRVPVSGSMSDQEYQ